MRKLVLVFFLIGILFVTVGISKSVVVKFWYSQTGLYSKAILDMAARFNEINKGSIEVKPVYSGTYDDTMQKLLAAVASGNPPAIAQIEQSRAGQLFESGSLQDLDTFIDKDPAFKYQLSDFFTALLEAGKYNGKIYAFPFNTSTPLLYYNKDLFRKAGLDPNKPPKTWDEVYEYAKKISELGKDIYGLRIYSGDWLMEAYIWQFGGKVISTDGKKILFNTPQVVEEFKFFRKMIDEGIAVYSPGKAGNALDIAGKIGMVCRSTGSLEYLKKNVKWDLGATVLPYEKVKAAPIGGGNIYMFKNVSQKVKEAAWKFLKYVTEPVNSLYWSLTTGYMTCRVSAFDSVLMGKHFEEEPRGLLTYKQLEYARRRPYFGPYPEVNSIIRSEWEAVMTKGKSPEDGVKDAAAKTQKTLDEYYK